MGRLVGKSWKLNQALDPGTNPEAVEAIIRRIDDYCLGYKLPGAGGGGYLYMVAKDPEAAIRIRRYSCSEPPTVVPVSLIWLCPTKACKLAEASYN